MNQEKKESLQKGENRHRKGGREAQGGRIRSFDLEQRKKGWK